MSHQGHSDWSYPSPCRVMTYCDLILIQFQFTGFSNKLFFLNVVQCNSTIICIMSAHRCLEPSFCKGERMVHGAQLQGTAILNFISVAKASKLATSPYGNML